MMVSATVGFSAEGGVPSVSAVVCAAGRVNCRTEIRSPPFAGIPFFIPKDSKCPGLSLRLGLLLNGLWDRSFSFSLCGCLSLMHAIKGAHLAPHSNTLIHIF